MNNNTSNNKLLMRFNMQIHKIVYDILHKEVYLVTKKNFPHADHKPDILAFNTAHALDSNTLQTDKATSVEKQTEESTCNNDMNIKKTSRNKVSKNKLRTLRVVTIFISIKNTWILLVAFLINITRRLIIILLTIFHTGDNKDIRRDKCWDTHAQIGDNVDAPAHNVENHDNNVDNPQISYNVEIHAKQVKPEVIVAKDKKKENVAVHAQNNADNFEKEDIGEENLAIHTQNAYNRCY